MSKDKETLLVIDGHSMAFRSFYGIKPDNFQLPSGQYTNAVYGFFNSLLLLMQSESPRYLAVAFDYSKKTFRKDEYPDYKEGRKPTPEEFKGQIALIQELLDAMNIKWFWKENYEADDIVATLAKMAVDNDDKVTIFSGDRDALQLVNKNVTLRYPKIGHRVPLVYTPESVEKDFGVPPHLYSDLAALTGEKADNLPGVPGLGLKTALGLVQKYGSLDAIFENLHELSGRYTRNLPDNVELVRRNRRLNTLLDTVPLDISMEDLRIEGMDEEKTLAFLSSISSNRLKEKILDIFPTKGKARKSIPKAQGQTCVTDEEFSKWLDNNSSDKYGIWITGNTNVENPYLSRVYISTGLQCAKLDFDLNKDGFTTFVNLLSNPKVSKVFFDYKGCLQSFYTHGITDINNVQDVMLQSYILDPDRSKYILEELIFSHLGYDISNTEEPEDLFSEFENDSQIMDLSCAILSLEKVLVEKLVERDLYATYEDIELPTSNVLFDMERVGIAIDEYRLEELEKEFNQRVEFAKRQAFESIGHEINLSSPKQLQGVLFDELKMPYTKKTRNGYTTNAEALMDLYIQTGHEFLGAVLEHRNVIKLHQIVKTLMKHINEQDGRIHTTFQQHGTATGRLSSVNPNLQNIPSRTDDGNKIREVFIRSNKYEGLMTADYSQIEMRIMAHLSEDETLITAFKNGEDLHKVAASIVYGIPKEAVTDTQRSHVKAVSYGLVYGLSPYGLSRQLAIGVGQARDLIDRYFERFGKVRDFLNDQVKLASENGFTTTIFGRKRYITDLDSGSYSSREAARRAALNAPIQGSAADIIKIAMVNISKVLEENKMKSKMLLQIHDELIFDVYEGERESLEILVRQAMGNATSLSVPLEVGIGFGNNWREAAH